MRKAIFTIFLSSSALTMAADPAFAQMTTPQQGAAANAPQAEDATAGQGDIIVTAQRRSERLTDVPIAITALSSDTLAKANIQNSIDVGLITPGLYMAQTGQNVQPTIRGIGTTISAVGADANVALYVDGVYQAAQTSNSFNLPDIDRIEVLKGPQGTLFGRNATGGAIVIHTKEPSFTPTGSVSVSYGSFREIIGRGWFSTGLGDKVAISVSGVSSHDRGYTRNITRNEWDSETDEDSVRGKILFKPTDDLKFTLGGNWSKRASNLAQSIKPLNRNVNVRATNPTLLLPNEPEVITINEPPVATVKSRGANFDAEWTIEPGTFSSITAYQKETPFQIFDTDYTSLAVSVQQFTTPSRTFTQELTFSSSLDGPLQFVTGLFYFDNTARLIRNSYRSLGGALTAFLDTKVDTTAKAAFGEVYFQATDRLKLIGGIRYNNEKKSVDGRGLVTGPNTLVNTTKWNSWTPRASALFEITDNTNVYATYSKGFKAGAYNPSFISGLPVQTAAVSPEHVTAYEVGLKHSDPIFRFNSSAFYYDYSNIQVQILTSVGGVNTTLIQNAATARIYGADFDFSLRVDPSLTVTGGAAYTKANYRDFPGAVLTTPLANGGNLQFVGDASGKQLVRSSRWMGNIGFNHRLPIGDNAIETSAVWSYTGSFFLDPGNRVKQNAFIIFNANIAYAFGPDGAMKVGVWGKNLLDEHYNIYAAQSTTGDNIAYGRPRSYGVMASFKF